MTRWATGLASTGVAALALAGCSHGGGRIVSANQVVDPKPSAAIRTMPVPPRGASPALHMPTLAADGRWTSPNQNLSSEESLWHFRMALNVAALACTGGEGDAIRRDYAAMLGNNKAALALANQAVDVRYRALYGAHGTAKRETVNTRVYNFFALPAVTPDLCQVAGGVAHEAAAMDAAALRQFAQQGLDRLEAPFQRFYTEYAAYRQDLAQWNQTGPRYADAGGLVTPPVPARMHSGAQMAAPAVASAPIRLPAARPTQVRVAAARPASAPKVLSATPVAAGGAYIVQLAAASSEDAMRSAKSNFVTRFGSAAGRNFVRGSAQTGSATLYRLGLGGFGSQDEASRACAMLKARGASCFVRTRQATDRPFA